MCIGRRRSLTNLAFALVFAASFSGAAHAGDSDFRVFEGGEERVLRLASEDEAHELQDGLRTSEALKVTPRVTVAVSRRALVQEVADRYEAERWSEAPAGLHYTFHYRSPREALAAAARMWLDGLHASPVIGRRPHPRSVPTDPLLGLQWHLRNTGQRGGVAGIDINASEAWKMATGRGIAIAIVDDGLEVGHPDLRAFPLVTSVARSLHYDFLRESTNPSPSRLDQHGTAVAGVAAAQANLTGGIGVAPGARLAGLRLTADVATDEQESRAFAWRNDRLHIYNNSWGPDDDGATVQGPGLLGRQALQRAVLFGRGGRGNIIVWAAGNGRGVDEANYDGYANSIHTIAVGAINDRGVLTTESEQGANVLVVAPSSSLDRQGLVTTDLTGGRGYNSDGANDGYVIPRQNLPDLDYTNDFGMTSGAAPQVAGVVALMLEANPDLGWRDVQEILLRTAKRVAPRDKDWRRNGAGWWFNHKYGAGLVDAGAAVAAARDWINLPGAEQVVLSQPGLAAPIPDSDDTGVLITFDASSAKDLRVEHVQFSVSVRHAWRGDLRYTLVSPSGMVSEVVPRPGDSGRRLKRWTFSSVRHWGESSRGLWQLRVADTLSGQTGQLLGAELVVRGSRITRTARRR